MYYAEKIKAYLEKENLTIKMFSLICGITVNTVYFILKGIKPSPGTARKIKIGTKGEIDLDIPYKANKWYVAKLPTFSKRKYRAKKQALYSEAPMVCD